MLGKSRIEKQKEMLKEGREGVTKLKAERDQLRSLQLNSNPDVQAQALANKRAADHAQAKLARLQEEAQKLKNDKAAGVKTIQKKDLENARLKKSLGDIGEIQNSTMNELEIERQKSPWIEMR
jgi:hypothetical protein